MAYNTEMTLVLSVLAVLAVLVGSELHWRRHYVRDEFSRKFVHITVGSFVAFWPFWLSWQEIRLLSLAFLIVVITSKYLGLFQAIHSVQRPTWGEIFFAAAVGVLTFITQDAWIYAAALLQMSLADGLAAVIGTRFGKRYKYSVFGHTKSIVGTATFFVTSLLIIIAYNFSSGSSSTELSWDLMVLMSALASLIENVGVQGLDNLLVPVAVALLIVNH